ncbi:hypothetical protein JIQ42_05538 [Leishmania sp. Namibia]|uniref:hypothetical protein n=1 Tax=Leishmania sp. Namibia TaxID=2802991 RepID=UPI001B76193D|nr:hypothetical protein JIQ42_05538 [Leishmania sp. Namibia]
MASGICPPPLTAPIDVGDGAGAVPLVQVAGQVPRRSLSLSVVEWPQNLHVCLQPFQVDLYRRSPLRASTTHFQAGWRRRFAAAAQRSVQEVDIIIGAFPARLSCLTTSTQVKARLLAEVAILVLAMASSAG